MCKCSSFKTSTITTRMEKPGRIYSPQKRGHLPPFFGEVPSTGWGWGSAPRGLEMGGAPHGLGMGDAACWELLSG